MADRRAHILAVTRQLMAESDGAVAMRSLAERSGVALATIYNIFGGQERLVAAALADMFNHRLPAWHTESQNAPFAIVDERIDAALAEIWREPVFAKRMSQMFFSHDATDEAARLLHDLPIQFYTKQAQGLRSAGLLRPEIDIHTWADDQLAIAFAIIARWATGHIGDDELASRLRGVVFAHLESSLTDQGRRDLAAYVRCSAPAFDGADLA